MIYLGLSILISTSIVVIFKSLERFKVNTFHTIVINYIIASSLAFLLIRRSINITTIVNSSWLPIAIMIGVFFIIMFYIMGMSTKWVGVTITTVSGRMSVIIPIIYSIIAYNEIVIPLRVIGIVLAVAAVVLSMVRKSEQQFKIKYLLLPVLLFFGFGLVDSIIKFAQQKFITDDILLVFIAIIFTTSGIIGILISIFRRIQIKHIFNKKVLFWGVLLGITNFGSIFFFVNALTYSGLDSSVVFGINHIGIVGLSVFFALLLFKEKLSVINWLGIALSFIAIFILSKS